jgi:hypothetical protein
LDKCFWVTFQPVCFVEDHREGHKFALKKLQNFSVALGQQQPMPGTVFAHRGNAIIKTASVVLSALALEHPVDLFEIGILSQRNVPSSGGKGTGLQGEAIPRCPAPLSVARGIHEK